MALQVLRILLGLGLAILAAFTASATMGLPLVPRPAEFEVPILSIARAAVPYLPFLGAIGLSAVALGEAARYRQLLYWLLAGAVAAILGYYALRFAGHMPAEAFAGRAPAKFVTMGAIAGFVYWLVAGRTSGALAAVIEGGAGDGSDPRRRCTVCAFAWMLLGLLPLGLVGWQMFQNAKAHLPSGIVATAEADALKLLQAAGLQGVGLKVDGKTGHVTGQVSDDAAKEATFTKAREILAPLVGVPGIVATLQNDLTTGAAGSVAAAAPMTAAGENAQAKPADPKQAEAERAAAEIEAKRKADEEAQLKAEAEREAKRKAEEEAARQKAEAERLAAEAEAKRKAEEDAARQKAEAERLASEAEAKRKAEEDAARQKAEAERLAAEAETKRKAEEEAAARQKAEAERLAAEAETKRKAEEDAVRQKAEAERLAAESEAKRKAEEEAARQKLEAERLAAEIEAKRKAAEEAQLKAEAEAEAKRQAEEAARLAADAEAKRAVAEELMRQTKTAAAEPQAGAKATPPASAASSTSAAAADMPASAAAAGYASCAAELEKITARRKIFFRSASADLRHMHAKILDGVAALAKRCSDLGIVVSGHTDATGDPQMNQQLSEERAEVVRAALVERGVDSKQLEVRAYADRQPADGVVRPYARAAERRAEFAAVPRQSLVQAVR